MENKKELHNLGSGLLPFDPIVLVQDVLRRWLVILLALSYLGTAELLTPVHVLLYQLVWMIPGLLITELTRTV